MVGNLILKGYRYDYERAGCYEASCSNGVISITAGNETKTCSQTG